MWVYVEPILSISAGLVALAAGSAAAWKIWRFLDQIEDAWAVLRDIAQQFEPNDGKSLYDRIAHLERAMEQVQRDIESVMIDRPRRQPAVRADLDVDGTPDGF